MSYYTNHVFFCTNHRENGKKCCQQAGATDMRDYAKLRCKELGLSEKQQVRINTSGCLGRCAEGPIVVIYPEGTWYTYANQNDIDEIIQSHLCDGKIVERLLLSQHR